MKPAVLVVFVDALGPREADLLVESGLALPHRASLTGVLGYSSGAIPTILTGVSPSRHGRMCLFSRLEPQAVSPLQPLQWLGLMPRIVHERARVRRMASLAIARLRGFDGYLALHRVPPALFARLDVPEREDLFKARDIGGVPTFLARAREAGLRVVTSDWRKPEASRIADLEAAPEADLVFLYLSGLDAILHRDGGIEQDARAWATQAASWVQRAQRAMAGGESRREVQTLVIGDHGMASVETVVDPRPTLAELDRLLGREFVFVDSTMLRVSAPAARSADARAILGRLPVNVLDAEGMAARDAPSDGRYGDLIALLPEGSIFAPSFVGGRVRGMHDYDRSSPSAHAALLSSEPLPPELGRLEDVAGWVCRALDLGPS